MPVRLKTWDALNVHKKIVNVLPRYEQEFRRSARKSDLDWTLLAAMAYQESHWSNDAVSPTGVQGIMQLTNDTARFLKIEDRLNVSDTIDGAARYIKFLKSKLPGTIKEPETHLVCGRRLQHGAQTYPGRAQKSASVEP